jgi:type I restriction enzyme M protein
MAKSDMLIKGDNPDLIRGGEKDHSKASTLANDQFFAEVFDYGLSNPPYGVDWKKDKDAVEREAARGYAGRFGAGTPRISDGQLLFLQHLISKMKPEKDGGSRIAIVHNGSPLFTGDAGSGESEIRRWILEKDLLEAIVALPDQLFYNTGINTYLWFVTNRKSKERKGKVQLIDARTFFKKTRKNLGSKRHEIDIEHKKQILDLYEKFEENEHSKIFKTTDFAYRQIQIERPLMADGKIVKNKKGEVEIDKSLRDYENVPYEMDINEYFDKEVKPYVPDAWINESVRDHKDGKVGVVGYEIPFTHFCKSMCQTRCCASISAPRSSKHWTIAY